MELHGALLGSASHSQLCGPQYPSTRVCREEDAPQPLWELADGTRNKRGL